MNATPQKKASMLRRFYNWSLDLCAKPQADLFISIYSYFEAIFIPTPVEPLLIARGAALPKRILWTTGFAVISSVLGAITAYFLGYYFWPIIEPIITKYIFSKETLDLVQGRFQSHAFLFIFIGGFTPLPFKAFTLSSGMMKLGFVPFVLGCIAGRSLRFFLFGFILCFFGERAREIMDKYLEPLFITFTVLLVIGAAYFFWRH